MVDGIASLLTVSHGRRQFGGYVPERGQNVLDGGAPFYTTYRTRDGKFMAVGAIEARFYKELLTGLGLGEVKLPNRAHQANWPVLRDLFAQRFAEKTREEWEAVFARLDTCVSPVLELAEAGLHPHNVARGMLITRDGVENPAPAPRLSETPAELRLLPVAPGQHTAEALADWGIPIEAIEAGLAAGYFAKWMTPTGSAAS